MPNEDNELCICCRCGDKLLPAQFYKTYSNMYSGINHIPICKTCFDRMFNEYTIKYKSGKMAMQRMCMAFNLYYNDSLFESCDENGIPAIGKYFRKLNIVQFKERSFDTSIDEGFKFSDEVVTNKKQVDSENTNEEIDPKDIERWGVGLELIDYENLNNHYKFLKSSNPNCDSNQEIFISDLCYTKMQQLKCVRNSDMENFKKMGEYYNSTFSKSGLKVVREAETNSDDMLGVWNARIAQYTPEEYYKNKELYRDNDNLGGYIERFLLRPLRNLMHGSQDRDPEFCVKENNDDDECTDTE